MKIVILTMAAILLFGFAGSEANADAKCTKYSTLTEQRAKAAVQRIQASGEVYYLGQGFVPPKLSKVKKVEALREKRFKTWELKLNGKTLEDLERVYVRVASPESKAFVSLLAELGCSEDKDEIHAKLVEASQVLSWALGVERVESSSALRGSQKYLPSNLVDGNERSAWCEGKRGPGVGESITIHFAKARMMTEVKIQPGFKSYPAPRAMQVFLNQSERPIAGKLSATFPRTEVSSLRIQIAEVEAHPLARTCIGAVHFWDGDSEYGIIQDASAKAMDALNRDMLALFAALNSCQASELGKYIDLPLRHYYASSDDGGHYEQESINYGSATSLASRCRKSGVLGARGTLIPLFDVVDHNQEFSHGGKLTLEAEDEMSEGTSYWTLAWNGTLWRLVSVSDRTDW